jgi:hypothetical protein
VLVGYQKKGKLLKRREIMAHRHEEEQKDGVLENGDIADKTGGGSIISPYDVTSWAFRRLISAGKKAPVISRKALVLISGLGKSGKTHRLETKVGYAEKKLGRLHYKIGEIGVSYSGEGNVLETEPVKALIAEVRENEAKIENMNAQIIEIKKQKEEKKKKRAVKREPVAVRKETVDKRDMDTITAAIDDAVFFGEFETPSEKEIFQKVANDLLDNEIEVRILAVAELAKMGKEAAVPILLEASTSNNSDLVSEIINSLISLGDLRAIPLFRERASDPGYRIRIGCLRGLYKLADHEDDIPVFTEALGDDHPEVRRAAATFLGWKDRVEAAPALTQSLRDEDRRVRKAAVSALANLKDESSVLPLIRVLADEEVEIRKKTLQTIRMISGNDEISFDVDADAPALEEAADHIRAWWEKERLERVYEDGPDVALAETEMMAAETAAEDEPLPVEDGEAPEDADPKIEDIDDVSDLGEDVVSEEESEDKSVEEIVGEDVVSEEETEDIPGLPEEVVPEEGETATEDEPLPVEDGEASDDADPKTEDIDDVSDLGEDIVSEEESGDESDAVEAPEQEDVGIISEEQTAFEESVDKSVEEIVGEDVVSEEETEDIPGLPEEVVPEEGETAAEEEAPVDETDEEDHQYREWQLKRMVKAELISICSDLGIDADENLLKSDLIALVLDRKE